MIGLREKRNILREVVKKWVREEFQVQKQSLKEEILQELKASGLMGI